MACPRHPGIPPELMDRIVAAVETAPETRPERVAEARQRLEAGGPEAAEIADSIIKRVIADALR